MRFSQSDFKILIALGNVDEATNTLLEKVTDVTMQHITKRLQLLESYGYVKREKVGLHVYTSLTERGRNVATPCSSLHPEEAEQIKEKLEKLSELIEKNLKYKHRFLRPEYRY